jgi:hypothetical protein
MPTNLVPGKKEGGWRGLRRKREIEFRLLPFYTWNSTPFRSHSFTVYPVSPLHVSIYRLMIYHFPLSFFCRGEITTQLRTPRLDSNTSDLLNEVTILPGISSDIPITILKRIGGRISICISKSRDRLLSCACTCVHVLRYSPLFECSRLHR